MKKKTGFIILFCLVIILPSMAQDPEWDDTSRPGWPAVFEEVEIPSTADGEIQMAYFYRSTKEGPQPLIVSLHTWSNNYQQRDPLIHEILARDYHYIRPDFRGPNYTPEAAGSPLVASDIDDAIQFALENSNVDRDNIHIIGVSGGGHATLIAYMQSVHPVRTFSSWVPISDLVKWYYESLGRQNRYARHISLATTGSENRMDIQEAISRSPLYMTTPIEKRKNSRLSIYAGIHDGYTGSVPITHALEMYNKVVQDFNPTAMEAMIPEEFIRQMVVTRYVQGDRKPKIADRDIHFARQFEDKVQIIIFEGGHEMLVDVALDHVPSKTIMAIGDSNGQNKGGWVDQLQALRFNDVFINTCISGNTIGFDNNGRESRNTLKNITRHLSRHDPEKDRIDKILIQLGTNDAKQDFDERLTEVPGLYHQLLDSIYAWYSNHHTPEIIMLSPPPIAGDDIVPERYHGSAARIMYMHEQFGKVADERGLQYIDIQTPLWPVFETLSRDGIHFHGHGYHLLGLLIHEKLDE